MIVVVSDLFNIIFFLEKNVLWSEMQINYNVSYVNLTLFVMSTSLDLLVSRTFSSFTQLVVPLNISF